MRKVVFLILGIFLISLVFVNSNSMVSGDVQKCAEGYFWDWVSLTCVPTCGTAAGAGSSGAQCIQSFTYRHTYPMCYTHNSKGDRYCELSLGFPVLEHYCVSFDSCLSLGGVSNATNSDGCFSSLSNNAESIGCGRSYCQAKYSSSKSYCQKCSDGYTWDGNNCVVPTCAYACTHDNKQKIGDLNNDGYIVKQDALEAGRIFRKECVMPSKCSNDLCYGDADLDGDIDQDDALKISNIFVGLASSPGTCELCTSVGGNGCTASVGAGETSKTSGNNYCKSSTSRTKSYCVVCNSGYTWNGNDCVSVSFPNCTTSETICYDGKDNDCDGKTDCADSDCYTFQCKADSPEHKCFDNKACISAVCISEGTACADFDGNNKIGVSDFFAFARCYGSNPYLKPGCFGQGSANNVDFDYNDDGDVDANDFGCFAKEWKSQVSCYSSFLPGNVSKSLPDLIISDIVAVPASPSKGKWANIRVSVKNQGLEPADASWLYYYYKNLGGTEVYFNQYPLGALNPGATQSWTDAEILCQGEGFQIRAVADGENQITESNEWNNEGTIVVSCSTPCDLTSASWSTTSVVEGTTVSLNVQGTNCEGKKISFVVWEADSLTSDDPLTNNPVSITFGTPGTWTAEWQSDESGDPEYYFIASVVGESETIKSSNQLSVSKVSLVSEICDDGKDNDGDGLTDCADYDCLAKVCGSGKKCFGTGENTCVSAECIRDGTACADVDGNSLINSEDFFVFVSCYGSNSILNPQCFGENYDNVDFDYNDDGDVDANDFGCFAEEWETFVNCYYNLQFYDEEVEELKGGIKGGHFVQLCSTNWKCSGWSDCVNGLMTRTCYDENNCGDYYNKPSEQTSCEAPLKISVKGDKSNFIFTLLTITTTLVLVLVLISLLSKRK